MFAAVATNCVMRFNNQCFADPVLAHLQRAVLGWGTS